MMYSCVTQWVDTVSLMTSVTTQTKNAYTLCSRHLLMFRQNHQIKRFSPYTYMHLSSFFSDLPCKLEARDSL